MINDYRYDPFTGSHDGVTISGERLFIPQNTPRYCMLDEVPVEESPSNVKVYQCDKLKVALNNSETTVHPLNPDWWLEGDVIVLEAEEVTLGPAEADHFKDCIRGASPAGHLANIDMKAKTAWSEVTSAPTASRTFQVDYNRGYMRFASTDNLKEILVDYKPAGSVISAYRGAIESLVFGDGSEGDLYVANGETLEIQGRHQYRNVYVAEGGILKPPASGYKRQIQLCVSEKLTVAGTITTEGFGCLGGQMSGANGTGGNIKGGAGGGGSNGLSGSGGDGGNSSGGDRIPGLTGNDGGAGGSDGSDATPLPADLKTYPGDCLAGAGGGAAGSGGGNGATGGGGLEVNAREAEITATGVVTTNGAKAGDGGNGASGGGGAGSQVWHARKFTNAGSRTANGGARSITGAGTHHSGAGANGIIRDEQVQ